MKSIILNVLNFILNTVKNSQFVNLIVASICYAIIFAIIVLGFSFKLYETQTVALIGKIASYMDSGNYTISAGRLISDYLTLLFFFGMIQEFIVVGIEKISKKNFHAVDGKNKKGLFMGVTAFMLVVEIIAAVIIKEYWLSLVGVGSFVLLAFFYAVHRVVFDIVNKIQTKINVMLG